MDINYREVAEVAVACAKRSNIDLDYSEKSIEKVESILGYYYYHLDSYDGKEGEDILWNLAVHFGIYLGESMLNIQLKEQGYWWEIDEGIPILKNSENMQISPVTKVHKRILYGLEDDVKSFCNVIFAIANGDFPSKGILRVVDIELPSMQCTENVLYRDIEPFIMKVANGIEKFIILKSQDGFLQFYGIKNQFVMEIRVNLQDNEFRSYSIVNMEKEGCLERINFNTPFGQFTPMEQELISLELVKEVIKKYYENFSESDLLKEIPYIETTAETKLCMGLM